MYRIYILNIFLGIITADYQRTKTGQYCSLKTVGDEPLEADIPASSHITSNQELTAHSSPSHKTHNGKERFVTGQGGIFGGSSTISDLIHNRDNGYYYDHLAKSCI